MPTAVVYFLLGIIAIGNNRINASPSDIPPTPDDDNFVFKYAHDVLITQENSDQDVSGHRTVLSASIPYIRDIEPNAQGKVEISLRKDIDISAVGSLIEFAYAQELQIDRTNVERLLRAAIYLRMHSIIEACTQYLIPRLSAETAVRVLNMADTKQLPRLSSSARDYLRQNFYQISQSEGILELGADAFLELIRSNDLNLSDEEPVFEVAVRWINHQPSVRSVLTWEVLYSVRFALLSLEYLTVRVKNEPLVKNSVALRELVHEATFDPVLPENEHRQEGCLRWPRNGTTHFFILDLNGSRMQIYEPIKKQLHFGTPMTTKRLQFGAVVQDCRIFVIAGSSSNMVEWYNAKSDTWKEAPPMIRWRHSAGVAALNDHIYVSGGEAAEDDILYSVESFDTATNSWSSLASMLTPRMLHQLVVFREYLWAVGGRSNLAWIEGEISMVERFDVLRNQWTLEKPMLNARMSFGAAVLDGKLYACGGNQLVAGTLDSAEVYDPVRQSWEMIAPMTVPRKYFSLLAHNGRLYAVGGTNDKGPTNGLDVYDPVTNTWEMSSTSTYPAVAVMLSV